MPKVSMEAISIGQGYDQNELAHKWGYKSYHAIRRGIVTPANQDMIILFITEKKVRDATQYKDKLEDNVLTIQGEDKHKKDNRLRSNISRPKDRIYLFYREIHHTPFVFYGEVEIFDAKINEETPSLFKFRLIEDIYTKDYDEMDIISSIKEMNSEKLEKIIEGKSKIIKHISYERSPQNRKKAIEIHGKACRICGADLDLIYGKEIANGYIEVHHVKELNEGIQEVDPAKDLLPVCPNCHRILHRKKENNISISELRRKIEASN